MAVNSTTLSSFTFNATTFEAVGNVSISSSRPPIEITQLGAANAVYVAGIITHMITMDIYYNKVDHQVLVDHMQNASAPAAFTMTINTTGPVTITGNALVVGLDVVATMGDIVRGSVTLQCTGAVTHTGTAAVAGGNEP